VVVSCRVSVEVISQHSFGGTKEKRDKISNDIRCPGYTVKCAPSEYRGISWGVNAAGAYCLEILEASTPAVLTVCPGM